MNATVVRSQDMVYVIRYVAMYSDLGKQAAWKFAENNWDEMMSIAAENNFHVQVINFILFYFALQMNYRIWTNSQ